MQHFLKQLKQMLKGKSSRSAFHFEVEWGDFTMAFQEASGLAASYQPEAYTNAGKLHRKVPGVNQSSTITLKRGIVSSAQDYEQIKRSVVFPEMERKDLVIRLLDEKQHLIAVCKVSAALPTKVEGPGLASGSNEVVVETIELAHEGLCIEGE